MGRSEEQEAHMFSAARVRRPKEGDGQWMSSLEKIEALVKSEWRVDGDYIKGKAAEAAKIREQAAEAEKAKACQRAQQNKQAGLSADASKSNASHAPTTQQMNIIAKTARAKSPKFAGYVYVDDSNQVLVVEDDAKNTPSKDIQKLHPNFDEKGFKVTGGAKEVLKGKHLASITFQLKMRQQSSGTVQAVVELVTCEDPPTAQRQKKKANATIRHALEIPLESPR
jgi:hypothetical protein